MSDEWQAAFLSGAVAYRHPVGARCVLCDTALTPADRVACPEHAEEADELLEQCHQALDGQRGRYAT